MTTFTPQRHATRNRAAAVGLVALAALAGAACAIAASTAGERAIARAINLRAADVPGFTPQRSSSNAARDPLNARLASCNGVTGTTKHPGAVDASSPSFMKSAGVQTEGVQSIIEIERSRRIVQSDLAVAQSGATRACLRNAFNGLKFSEQGIPVIVKGVRVTRLPVSAPGAEGSFGIRMKMSITALFLSVPLQTDIIGIAVGRDEVSLATSGSPGSFPRQTELQLTSLLLSRALANAH